MPIHHAIWRVGEQPAPLVYSRLASEQQLEDMIVRDPRILSSEWMLIGRQEVTSHGGRVDLLAIAPDASLVLIELKRDRTPREIIAQALDYASWVGAAREGLQGADGQRRAAGAGGAEARLEVPAYCRRPGSRRVLRAGQVARHRAGEQGCPRGRLVRQPEHRLPADDAQVASYRRSAEARFPAMGGVKFRQGHLHRPARHGCL